MFYENAISNSLYQILSRDGVHLLFLCKWLHNIFKHGDIHSFSLNGENVWKWFREVRIIYFFASYSNEFRFWFFATF